MNSSLWGGPVLTLGLCGIVVIRRVAISKT